MMHDDRMAWLVGRQLQSFVRREFDWVMTFDSEAKLVIECLWRLIEDGRIRLTSQDDGHQFGLPAPVDAAVEMEKRIAGSLVEAVMLCDGILDLKISLSNGHDLQIIPNSSGYEAWTASDGRSQFIAVGGGELVIFD